MPLKIEPCDEIKTKPYTECDCQIFDSKAEMRRSLKRLCYGDLYVIGRLWIESMKTVLVGSKLCLIPVVEAKKKEEIKLPEKPPPTRYKDLALYQGPYIEYFDYEEEKVHRADASKKILHSALLPHVTHFRSEVQSILKGTKQFILDNCNNVYSFVSNKHNEFLGYARSSSHLNERRAAVALGATVGFLYGYKTGKGVTKPWICSGIAALVTGAACFPKETDETFRIICWNVFQLTLSFYNNYCNKNITLKGKVPCENTIPPPPPPKTKKEIAKEKEEEQCPEKKKK